jgi:predicted transglutaminase-like cysteine proteinase
MRHVGAVIALATAFWASGSGSVVAPATASPTQRAPLYRIADYPYPTAPALQQWQSVLRRNAAEEARWTGETCVDGEPSLDCAAKQMALLEEKLRDRAPKEQIRAVYAFFNAVKYKEHGPGCDVDCWATRLSFAAKREGDCGDHALAEYFTLRRLGFAERDLQLIIAQLPGYEDSFKGGHVVLRVRTGDDYYILDNRRKSLVGLEGLAKYKVLAGLNADSVQIYNLVTPAPPPGFIADAEQVAALIASPGASATAAVTPETVSAPEPVAVVETAAAEPEEDCVQGASLGDWNPNLPCSPKLKIVVTAKSWLTEPAAKAKPPAAPARVQTVPVQTVAQKAAAPKAPAKPARAIIEIATNAPAADDAATEKDARADDAGSGCVQLAASLADWNPNLPCSDANPNRITVKAKAE